VEEEKWKEREPEGKENSLSDYERIRKKGIKKRKRPGLGEREAEGKWRNSCLLGVWGSENSFYGKTKKKHTQRGRGECTEVENRKKRGVGKRGLLYKKPVTVTLRNSVRSPRS